MRRTGGEWTLPVFRVMWDPDTDGSKNQTVFVRGYKIAIRGSIFRAVLDSAFNSPKAFDRVSLFHFPVISKVGELHIDVYMHDINTIEDLPSI